MYFFFQINNFFLKQLQLSHNDNNNNSLGYVVLDVLQRYSQD